MRCKNCQYSLANLTGPPHRCPECGREFDPNDSNTFESPKHRRRYPYWNIVLLSLMLGWLTLFVGLTCWAYFDTAPGGWFSGPRGAIGIGLILGLFMWYWALIPAFIIALVWILLERRRRATYMTQMQNPAWRNDRAFWLGVVLVAMCVALGVSLWRALR